MRSSAGRTQGVSSRGLDLGWEVLANTPEWDREWKFPRGRRIYIKSHRRERLPLKELQGNK